MGPPETPEREPEPSLLIWVLAVLGTLIMIGGLAASVYVLNHFIEKYW